MAVDHGWDALVAATNANVSEERGALNRSLSQIREQSGLEGEELGREITYRAVLYREVWPEMALTATALAKHWERLPVEHGRMRDHATQVEEEERGKRKKGVNLRARHDCVTCGGDSWVVVRFRSPFVSTWMREQEIKLPNHPNDRGFEETAPCPICGPEQERGKFWAGRTWNYGKDPGELVLE